MNGRVDLDLDDYNDLINSNNNLEVANSKLNCLVEELLVYKTKYFENLVKQYWNYIEVSENKEVKIRNYYYDNLIDTLDGRVEDIKFFLESAAKKVANKEPLDD